MPTAAEQAATIRGLVAQGDYTSAYTYTATQLEGSQNWDQNVVEWLEFAAAINGSEPNFWKDWVFTSNAIAAGLDPNSAEAQQLSQLASNQLAQDVLIDIAIALENQQTISPAQIFNDEIAFVVSGLGIPEWAWAGGPLGTMFGFPVFETVYDTRQELLDWTTNALKTSAALMDRESIVVDRLTKWITEFTRDVLKSLYDIADEATGGGISYLSRMLGGFLDDDSCCSGGGLGGDGGGGGGGAGGLNGGNDGGNYPPNNKPQPCDPLLLDLDGNGITLIAPTEGGALFDIDNDGFREQVGWVTGGDGFLAVDANSNGSIDSLSELFGTAELTGHQHLAQFDLNSDGKIDSDDAIWNQLRVWVDSNGDGLSQTSEIQLLGSHGIASISLATTAEGQSQPGGQLVSSGGLTFSDGHISAAYSANLLVNQAITEQQLQEGFEFNPATIFLPSLSGIGNIPDLNVAMTLDPMLLQMVTNFVNKDRSATFESFVADAKAILFQWAGVANVNPNSRGGGLDGREVAVVELITGESYSQTLNMQSGYGPGVDQYFDLFFDAMFSRLMGQAWQSHWLMLQVDNSSALLDPSVTSDPLMLLFGGLTDGRLVDQNLARNLTEIGTALLEQGVIDHDAINQLVVPTLRVMLADRYGSAEDAYAPLMRLIADTPGLDVQSAGVGWAALTGGTYAIGTAGNDTLQAIATDSHLSGGAGDDHLTASSSPSLISGGDGADQVFGGSNADLLLGGAGNDTISGNGGADILVGGAGNDSLNGGDGSDTYLWSRGDGNDTLTETTNNGGADKLVLQGVAPASVTLGRSGTTLILTIAESAPGAGDGGVLTLPDSFDGQYEKGVEQIAFDDGTVWTDNDLRLMWLAATSTPGNDTITGFNTADTIRGGTGNDTINGGDGSDTYLWARGDGSDTITESNNNGTADSLVLEGINPGDVNLSRNGDSVTLLVSESAGSAGDGGSILLVGVLDSAYEHGVEQIRFADGTVWTQATLRSMVVTAAGTAGNDTITGTASADWLRGGAGNDTINGGDGSDTYLWARGDGSDTLTETINNGSVDKFVLEGVNPADVTIGRSGGTLILTIASSAPGAGDGGVITMADSFDGSYEKGFERIAFGDGTVWTDADVRAHWLASASTSGNDVIAGFTSADVIHGGAGNDTLNGGDGADEIYGDDGADTLSGGNSSDSLFGGAGNDFLYGNDGNDTLAGGTGNERLEGGSGVDTYIYNVGDGDDVIYDASYDSSPDETLIFGEGISTASLVFTRSTADVDDLIISFSGFAGSIVLDEQFKNAGVELFRFSDGSTMTEDQAYALAASGGGGSGSAMMTSQDPTSPDFGIAMLGFARPSLWLEVPEVV